MIAKSLCKLAVLTVGAALSFVVVEASNIRLAQAANLSFNFNVSDYTLDRFAGYVLQNTQSGTYSVAQNSFNAALASSSPVTIPIIEGGSLDFLPAGSIFGGGSFFNINLASINRFFPEVSDNLSAPGFGDIPPGTAINCGIATCGATYIGRGSGESIYTQTPVVPEPSYTLPVLLACGFLVSTVRHQRATNTK